MLTIALCHDLVRKKFICSDLLQVLINSSVCLLNDMFVFIQELFEKHSRHSIGSIIKVLKIYSKNNLRFIKPYCWIHL